ncbi:hypothetical protein JTF57_gp16 [Microbacterium phage PoRanda]|uniref:Uncharacterized protein n=1 Tax=Microbacterium phage PoRanda TaxID=2743924 RepID=A0AAE7K6C4_9CAUD|nr:hypothetical protein JTF57_gp16 [Microbacterium phage PoRanda]QKY80428.1 hypothetical protein SEA_PORANDA_16 [Microbacterium phage PoRanda]UVK63287.1 hypothetical protein SEA_UPSILON_16 [Microbacterium phage Upsilon]
MTLIEDVLSEQIAALRASAGLFVRQRADALAAAEAAAVQAAGADARAAALQAELDAYRELLPAPEIPETEPADEPPADETTPPLYQQLLTEREGN